VVANDDTDTQQRTRKATFASDAKPPAPTEPVPRVNAKQHPSARCQRSIDVTLDDTPDEMPATHSDSTGIKGRQHKKPQRKQTTNGPRRATSDRAAPPATEPSATTHAHNTRSKTQQSPMDRATEIRRASDATKARMATEFANATMRQSWASAALSEAATFFFLII
jgi:hypothetical protein